MSSLLVMEISREKRRSSKYRSWIPADDMEATLTSIELHVHVLREKCMGVPVPAMALVEAGALDPCG